MLLTQSTTPVSYTHLDVYKRQVFLYLIINNLYDTVDRFS